MIPKEVHGLIDSLMRQISRSEDKPKSTVAKEAH